MDAGGEILASNQEYCVDEKKIFYLLGVHQIHSSLRVGYREWSFQTKYNKFFPVILQDTH